MGVSVGMVSAAMAYAPTTKSSTPASLNADKMSLKFGFSTGGVHKCPGIERHWPSHCHPLGGRGVRQNTTITLILERRFDNPGPIRLGTI